MIHSLKNIKILVVLTGLIMSTGCFDKPDEFVAPTWNAEVNFPITQKSFTLLELVEKDSSFLKSSKDPESLGLIFFGDTQSVSSITIEDELKIDGFETDFSNEIGSIDNIIIPVTDDAEIRVEDWTTDVTSGSFQIFPEQEGNVTLPIEGINTVESILAEDGNLRIFIHNNLPVPIVLRGVAIRNVGDQSIIAERSGSDPGQWVYIPKEMGNFIVFPIEDKVITNNLEYVGTIYSVGSNGDSVQVPEEAGTTIYAIFSELTVGAATAQLPVQTFAFNDTLKISDSTKIEEAVIYNGRAVLTATNNMDVDLTANVYFDNLFDNNGEKYSVNIPLARNEENRVIEISTLKNWSVVTSTPGVPTNELTYSIYVSTDSTGEISTISKNDDIFFNLNFDELTFESFTGQLKPTNFALENTGIQLDYGDINEQFGFEQINFEDAEFRIDFSTSTDMDLLINGDLEATNGTVTNSKTIQDILVPSVEPVSIDITDLINGFTTELPDSFSLEGNALLNPNYLVSTVRRGDSVYGAIEYEIPLNVGIAGGTYIDTIDISLGDVDEDDIERLNYAEATFIIENTVPVNLTFTSSIMDSSYTPVLNIPTPENNLEYIEVPKPEMGQNGEIISSGKKTQIIALYGEDVQKLLNNPYLLIEVTFETAGTQNAPVKFKTSSGISFEVKAHAEYKVEI